MPFTPFHLGPASLMGVLFSKIFDFQTLLLASIIIDLEHLPTLIFGGSFSHIFFHNFLAGSLIAILLAKILYFFKRKAKIEVRNQKSSFKKILWSSFFGIYFHIFLDSFLYPEMKPFYPLRENPFLTLFPFRKVYLFSTLSFLAAATLYLIKLKNDNKR